MVISNLYIKGKPVVKVSCKKEGVCKCEAPCPACACMERKKMGIEVAY